MSDIKDFVWTDELVAEYSLDEQRLTIWDFKRKKLKEKDIPKNFSILEMGCNCDPNKIFSIQRISDGEVFSIGDRLADMEIGEEYIDGFKLNYKGNDVWVSVDIKNGCGVSLDSAKKVKPKVPLFTTADLKEVFPYDTFPVYKVDSHFQLTQFAACDAGNYPHSKYYYNKEKAEENILLNKQVQVSYKEFLDFYNKQPNYSMTRQILKDFFQSKINP